MAQKATASQLARPALVEERISTASCTASRPNRVVNLITGFIATLFGLLAVEIAVTMKDQGVKNLIGGVLVAIALFFVYRSFYGMRIPDDGQG